MNMTLMLENTKSCNSLDNPNVWIPGRKDV